MLANGQKNAPQPAIGSNEEIGVAVVADASRSSSGGLCKDFQRANASRSAGSTVGPRIAIGLQSFSKGLDAAGRLEGVDEPGQRTGNRPEKVAERHSKFSVGCVATPTGAHPAALVKLAGGVIAPAMA